ncbi:UNVERIFIED_CONTAM: hypothetical protein Scaly_1914400 [Sesamum calycinum]|uniref:Transposase MuDR plant domain-containing protein n=1 Tax=Sesamum calycinum TaxID=2727403 RepID=A0AAW2NHQ6_9LAMI
MKNKTWIKCCGLKEQANEWLYEMNHLMICPLHHTVSPLRYENSDSGMGSDEENSEKFRMFSQSDTYDPKFDLGMMFSTKNEFRVAVQSHAIKTRRNVKLTKNDKRRIYAKCVEEGCEWRINTLAVGSTNSFQIGSTIQNIPMVGHIM